MSGRMDPGASGPQDVQPWPRWLRYPVIGVLVALAAVGIAIVVTGGTDTAVIRIVVAAVLIPALLAPVQLWARLRRTQRRADVEGRGSRRG